MPIDRDQILKLELFAGLEAEELSVALAAFRSFEVGGDEALLEEGEPDRSMIVLLEGEVAISLAGVELARVGAGECIGEMALFGTFDRRAATARTVGLCKFILIDEEGLRYLRVQDNPMARTLEAVALQSIARRLRDLDFVIAQTAEGQDETKKSGGFLGRLARGLGVGSRPSTPPPSPIDVLNATSGFAGRDTHVLASIASRLQVVTAGRDDAILEEGTSGDDAFIIAEGRVAISCKTASGKSQRVAVLSAGHIFGHVSLADARVRTATCTALDPVYLLRIPGTVFRQLILETSAEGRSFRRGIIDALSSQLRLANEHLVAMVLKHAPQR